MKWIDNLKGKVVKKILFSLGMTVLLSGAANAQVSYGLKADVNLARITDLGSNKEGVCS